MDLSQSLIPFVSQTHKGGVKLDTTTFEEAEVMGSAFAMSTTDNLPRCLIDDHLRFQGVSLALSAVEGSLFLGRSMGCSTTSTTVMTS